MTLKTLFTCFGLSAIMLTLVGTANAQPVWTDVMNAPNNITAASGNYFPLGSGTNQYETSLNLLPIPYTLNVGGVSLPTSTTYWWNCGGTNSGNGTISPAPR